MFTKIAEMSDHKFIGLLEEYESGVTVNELANNYNLNPVALSNLLNHIYKES